MSSWILETEKLTKTLGGKAVVNDVKLQIGKGDIYGFLGPNGAGKTTTIRMLLGLAKPTHGSIRIFGKELRKERLAILRKVGSLVEYPSYYGHLSAEENLETVRRLLDVPRTRIGEVLDMVRLTSESKRPVKGFSLGMKQRLGIATALLGQPELLILDEPTNGLDPAGILEIRELIKRMPEELGVTVVVSSHLLSEMEQMATRVGIIAKGRMIFQDSIQSLQAKAPAKIRLGVSEPESAWRMLLSAGYQADWDRSRLTVNGANDHIAAAIVSSLVRHDFEVYRVEREGASLEHIFLDMTGGEGSL
ncbi:ABC-2 type transport system ATP-binding protein [Paenibacillus sp. UNCCL117]|uniref:ABC transporter ATP-binding protein n=1 Tax=unclassified Paenibacillus TaxID=185978 RepID=UPI000884D358|nr:MULTISPECIES: ABC transporter ATP-binding protein [unclassified Paenibacillus]SDC49671.1 ABC-2 type transport system ATP-binding protein [Paenibacillus sp. cl123]SFW11721.1 ABC-2 type transport system ATP-binding protein [Paenibacillus sp. UNCCL117]